MFVIIAQTKVARKFDLQSRTESIQGAITGGGNDPFLPVNQQCRFHFSKRIFFAGGNVSFIHMKIFEFIRNFVSKIFIMKCLIDLFMS